MKLYLTYEDNSGEQCSFTAYGDKKVLRSLCSLIQKSYIVLGMSIKDNVKSDSSSTDKNGSLPF